jgi:hypothetical protein
VETKLVVLLLEAVVVIGTALWAAWDSSRIGLRKYKSGISYPPAVLFIGIVGLWIVGFPWYLIVRHRIRTGQAALRAPKGP